MEVIVYLTLCVLEELTVQTVPNIVKTPEHDTTGQLRQVDPDKLKIAKEVRLPFFVRDLHLPGISVRLFDGTKIYQYSLTNGTPVAVRESNDEVVQLIRMATADWSTLNINGD